MTESGWGALVAGLFGPEVLVGASPACASPDDLFPAERAAIAGAVPWRQREFAAGRVCARRLLARLGLRAAPLPPGADGRPCWPAGFVGSIAHAGGLCVAAVARRRDDLAGLGIDVEVARGLDESMWKLVCTPAELERVRRQPSAARAGLLATALFSAKESTYKCGVRDRAGPFEPRAIDIDWDGTSPVFHARIVDHALHGRIALRGEWILTGISR